MRCLHLSVILLLFYFSSAFGQKINGISIVAPRADKNYPSITEVKNIGANWVCIMPYAFVDETKGEIKYNHPKQWWGEKTEGIAKAIFLAKQNGMQVMVKPMLWLKNGKYTGELAFDQYTKWGTFEESYHKYLWEFAEIADSLNAEIFCLGTELKSFIQFKPNYFPETITTFKDSFNFKLTYAANWDNYKNITFWNKLNFIGIDAYFPGSTKSLPSVEEAGQAMVRTKYELKDFAEKNQKQILFTEYGFRSCINCAGKPWEHSSCTDINFSCQLNTYTAFFEKLYHEDWCAGGFLWKWYDTESEFPASMESDYSPQGKPTIEVIKQNFK